VPALLHQRDVEGLEDRFDWNDHGRCRAAGIDHADEFVAIVDDRRARISACAIAVISIRPENLAVPVTKLI